MTSPVDEIRALASRAEDDARGEREKADKARQAANDAMIRASAYEDKAFELEALARRIEANGPEHTAQISD